jgi:hypothetical protein
MRPIPTLASNNIHHTGGNYPRRLRRRQDSRIETYRLLLRADRVAQAGDFISSSSETILDD